MLETSGDLNSTKMTDLSRISGYESNVPQNDYVSPANNSEYEHPCNQLSASSDENHVYTGLVYEDR